MDVHWRGRASAMLAIVHAKPESVIFSLFKQNPGKETDPEQECKIKPNLFSVSGVINYGFLTSVSVEVEQEQARKDKSIAVSVTPDYLSSALQTFKKSVLKNGQENSDGKRYY